VKESSTLARKRIFANPNPKAQKRVWENEIMIFFWAGAQIPYEYKPASSLVVC